MFNLNEKIHRIFELCLKCKEVGADAFFYYSPHVGNIDISIFCNGWGESKRADYRPSFCVDPNSILFSEEKIKEAEDMLLEILEEAEDENR